MTNEYIGMGQFAGWRFTMTRSGEGYIRHTITEYKNAFDSIRGTCEYHEKLTPGYTAKRKAEIENPPDVWLEENWLTQWLKHGLIKLVKDDKK